MSNPQVLKASAVRAATSANSVVSGSGTNSPKHSLRWWTLAPLAWAEVFVPQAPRRHPVNPNGGSFDTPE